MPASALTYSSQGKARFARNATGSAFAERDALVMEHAEMVRRVALHMADQLNHAVEPDDLIQTGLIGLLEAAERYSPMENISFEAYALPRIRGAMVDSLRKNDWCSRSIRKKGRLLKEARSELKQKLGRNPTDPELAEVTGFTVEECRKTEKRVTEANMVSLEVILESSQNLLPVEADKVASPIIRQRFQAALIEALKQLPEREQMIMHLYYSEELNQKEIARVLNLTEPRISQLRTKAIKSLRTKLLEWM